ncbi:hypothetical protein JKP88DRAFT_48182 [Tribonema minus]|uniref:Uncharacterized protein n=1 Tax=Tribonema minus TaxID=303371 RepID=A0A835YZA2_9STRA|nr:hypothetical protein JKP88DRAFT_48182 [Tribonema minus]
MIDSQAQGLPASYQRSYGSETAEDVPLTAGRDDSSSAGWSLRRKLTAGVGALALVVTLAAVMAPPSAVTTGGAASKPAALEASSTEEPPAFDELGRFVLRGYDDAKPWSSFLPGLGGKFGMPMWAFYVNRGQGIAAFGTENKEHPLMEFNSANKAYQNTPYTGFRTFLKVKRGDDEFIHQPFFPTPEGGKTCPVSKPQRDMLVGMNELELLEDASDLGLKTKVQYFTLPDEDFAALVRRTTFINTDPNEPVSLQILDGMPRLQPFGVTDWHLKNMGRTLEGWYKAFNYKESAHTLPFFKLTASVADSEEVTMVVEGNWALSYIEQDGELMDGSVHSLLPIVADPTTVFGQLDTPVDTPQGLVDKSVAELVGETMVTLARTPCALAAASVILQPGESVTVTSLYGRAKDQSTFTGQIAPLVSKRGYVSMKHNVATKLTDDLTAVMHTATANPVFDAHVRQMFLDNLLRGGYPIMMGDASRGEELKVYHTFSRIHGDLERDYNYFKLDLTYYSQGPGNFRDINQNRRTDVLLDPRVGDFNVRTFLSFVQSDAYNPLNVANAQFFIQDKDAVKKIVQKATGFDDVHLTGLLERPFRPGDLFLNMEEQNVELTMDREDFLNLAASEAVQVPQANFSQNGFWADHWTYHLDLVENYLTVFPEKEEQLLYDAEPVPFFQSPAQVNPRDKKYVLTNESAGTVRQYGCMAYDSYKTDTHRKMETLVDGIWQRYPTNSAKKHAIGSSRGETDALTDTDGEVYRISIAGKLAMLAVLKFAQLDPQGMGVEMEGGKPGWNDAMNGLPGMIGSGMPETFELLRLLHFMEKATRFGRSIRFPTEFSDLLTTILNELDAFHSDFQYWDNVATARELYRNVTTYQFSGEEQEWDARDLEDAFSTLVDKVQSGVDKAVKIMGGVTPTYFSYEVTDFDYVQDDSGKKTHDPMGRPYVRAKAFKVHKLPQFLEGNVRHFKVLKDHESKLTLYRQTRGSSIYDQHLKMYRLSESLDGQSFEIGRMMAFAPGWLENTSIWLHMSYKLYLELLRAGLFSEFWEEVQTGMTAFMDPAVFGRSPLEAASFIVSSFYPDDRLHGTGFLARLSGSTAEFLSMWHLMMQGPTPFVLDAKTGELNLKLEPALPSWLFKDDGTVSFMFLGGVTVTYHNPQKLDTWELGYPVSASIIAANGEVVEVDLNEGTIPAPYAEMTRDLGVSSIDIYF